MSDRLFLAKFFSHVIIAPPEKRAKVAELVDALDLGSSASRRESSSLSFRTMGSIQVVSASLIKIAVAQ